MKTNEGKVDRLIRGAGGAVLVGLAVAAGVTEVAGILMIAVAAVLLLTAISGFCPLYRVFGVSTVPKTRPTPDARVTHGSPR